jgi:uncharacterized membrane protein
MSVRDHPRLKGAGVRRSSACVALALGLGACHYDAFVPSTAPPVYTIQELGLLSGGKESQATAGSAAGIVGWATDAAGARHAVVFARGSVTRLDEPAAVQASEAVSVNAQGTVVGTATLLAGTEAVAWPAATAPAVVLPGLGGVNSAAFSINDQGVILGAAQSSGGETAVVLWQPGARYAVAPFDSVPRGNQPVGLNNRMQAALNDGLSGMFWFADTLRAISVPNAASSVATGLNNLGVVVGGLVTPSGRIGGFLYTETLGAFQLGAPPGAYTDVVATAINDSGRVAGAAFTVDGTGQRLSSAPVVGTVIDSVHTLTPLSGLGGNRAEPSDNAITACGIIPGWATTAADTSRQAVAWVPTGCSLP